MKKIFFIIILLLLLMTGCNKGNVQPEVNNKTEENPQTEVNNEAEENPQENKSESGDEEVIMAPDFELESLDGTMVKLSEQRDKNVIINFWGTWCGFCVEEMPDLQKLQDSYKDDGLLILAVNVGDTKEEIEEFMEENNLSLTVLMDKDSSVQGLYGVSSFPSTLAVNKKGEVIAGYVGMLTYEQMEQIYGFFEE